MAKKDDGVLSVTTEPAERGKVISSSLVNEV